VSVLLTLLMIITGSSAIITSAPAKQSSVCYCDCPPNPLCPESPICAK
jgi:hypothetical protein